ncbi:DUF5362 domain-containing protein [Halomonas dongshanensis]|uniref:DUF5362 domain-containing protein n=1 Tax=Halomonas dongshanensis TaxID=2890835 RepID=A0ABT2EB47_9GAMM|nr:DUF5362 domain-containing protein [Halomonas dongshanensis]MCS2608807.1 DUF5362 domain-containing protein [Halomonas dongshanensis]
MESQQLNESLRGIIEPLYRAKFWIQLNGIMLILAGILIAISIVGILIAWLPIWVGVVLMQAAKSIDKVYHSGDEREMRFALSKIKTYFTIFGVMILLQLLFMVIMMFWGGMGFSAMMSSY